LLTVIIRYSTCQIVDNDDILVNELNWTTVNLNWIELEWTELDLDWTELEWAGLDWTWTELNFIFHRKLCNIQSYECWSQRNGMESMDLPTSSFGKNGILHTVPYCIISYHTIPYHIILKCPCQCR
jgi:hypothetical protein